MATVNVLIKFKGNTEEALALYRDAFDGEYLALLRYGDDAEAAEQIDASYHQKVAFVALDVGNHTTIMASDILPSQDSSLTIGNNVTVYMNVSSNQVLDEVFGKLSQGGVVDEVPHDTAWGSYYCSFTDKFGIVWALNYQRDLGPLSRRP